MSNIELYLQLLNFVVGAAIVVLLIRKQKKKPATKGRPHVQK